MKRNFKTIYIFNLKFTILEVEEIYNDNDVLGRINYIKQTIYLKSKLSYERKKIVLLHEILHCIFELLGFNEEHENEPLIDSLSTAIYQVLITNKSIFS